MPRTLNKTPPAPFIPLPTQSPCELLPQLSPWSDRESRPLPTSVLACPLLLGCCGGLLCGLPAASIPSICSLQCSQGGLPKADLRPLRMTWLTPYPLPTAWEQGPRPSAWLPQCPRPASVSSCSEPTAHLSPGAVWWLGWQWTSDSQSLLLLASNTAGSRKSPCCSPAMSVTLSGISCSHNIQHQGA